MTREAARNALLAELRDVQARIDAAYWRFTRCRRAKPPSLAEPAAYRRRAELEALLKTADKPVTDTMLRMLRFLAKQPNGIDGVPYRTGASNTAKALHRRGLVVMWPRNGGRMMALTDAGRTVIAAHPEKEKPRGT